MIEKVMGLTVSKKNGFSKQNYQRSYISVPNTLNHNLKPYTAENIKANYMPMKVSFGSSNLPAVVNNQPLKNIDQSKRYIGAYYNNLSDDTAIVLGSEKDLLFTAKNGVDAEIFTYNFLDRIEAGKYKGMGLDKKHYDTVSYIGSPRDLYNQNVDITKLLSTLQNREPNKKHLVVINNFEQIFKTISRTEASDMKEYLGSFHNINIIGVVDETIFTDKNNNAKLQMAEYLKNLSKLNLNGLNTAQTKEFIKKNPNYINPVLNRFDTAKMKISENALENLIEKSAVKMDMALPNAAKTALTRLSVAKINEIDLKNNNKPVMITTKDVDNFFLKHSAVLEDFKPEAGQFTLAENITTKLSDVGGISSIKQEIQEDLIDYLKNPEKFTAERGTAPKGVLLEGPPGTGKTLLARAIAGETNTPFISASGSEFVEKYVGVGAQRVRELFKNARSAAENSPNHTAIVFIDEFDALARARTNDGGGGNREAEQTLNQLLTEMDGFNNKESKTKVVVIAATNRKDMLDKAAIRAGRFDDVFKVDNPRTVQDRLEIMSIHSKNLNFASQKDKEQIMNDAAKLTEGMSGAELAGVMNRVKKIIAKRPDNKVVTYNDIHEAYLQTIAGPVQKTGDERPVEDVIEMVRHEGGHATVIDCLNPLLGDKINFITLDKRGNFLGAVFRKPSEMSPNLRSVILSAAVGYAGGMAEPEFDKQGRSAGVSQDVAQATRLFRKAITEWGQGVYTPPITMVPNSHENDAQANSFYDTLRASNQENIAKDIALFSTAASTIAAMVTKFHKGFLDEYVDNFKANAGKGGNSLSGAEFTKLRHEWIVKNGKLKAEKKLLAKIDRLLTRVMNKNSNVFERFARRIAKTI